MYRASSVIWNYDQHFHNYFTNYHNPTCFDTIVSSSGSLQPASCQVTQAIQMQVARYWLEAPWSWHDSVETCRNVIICETIFEFVGNSTK